MTGSEYQPEQAVVDTLIVRSLRDCLSDVGKLGLDR